MATPRRYFAIEDGASLTVKTLGMAVATSGRMGEWMPTAKRLHPIRWAVSQPDGAWQVVRLAPVLMEAKGEDGEARARVYCPRCGRKVTTLRWPPGSQGGAGCEWCLRLSRAERQCHNQRADQRLRRELGQGGPLTMRTALDVFGWQMAHDQGKPHVVRVGTAPGAA